MQVPPPPHHPPALRGARPKKIRAPDEAATYIDINTNINLGIHIKNKYKDKDKENKSAYFTGDDIN